MMHAALPSMPSSSESAPSCGGTLVSIDGRALPLRGARLSGRHRAGLGRITLEQSRVQREGIRERLWFKCKIVIG